MAQNKKCLWDCPHRILAEALNTTAKELRSALDLMFRPYGMSRSRWLVLVVLQDEGCGMSQKELAARMNVEGATLVRILDGMEKDGWVRRRVSETDRRVNLVELEDKAKEFMSTFDKEAGRFEREVFAGIPEEEIAACTVFLNRLQRRLTAWSAELKA